MNMNVVPFRSRFERSKPETKKVVCHDDMYSSTYVETPISLLVTEHTIEGPILTAERIGSLFVTSRVDSDEDDDIEGFQETVEFAGIITEATLSIEGYMIVKQYYQDELVYEYNVGFVVKRVMYATHKNLSEYVGNAIGVKRNRLPNAFSTSTPEKTYCCGHLSHHDCCKTHS